MAQGDPHPRKTREERRESKAAHDQRESLPVVEDPENPPTIQTEGEHSETRAPTGSARRATDHNHEKRERN